MYPSEESSGVCFIADNDSSEVVEPTVSSFDFESFLVPSQGTTVLLWFPLAALPMRADQLDAAFLHESCSQWVTIGCFVIQEMFGSTIT